MLVWKNSCLLNQGRTEDASDQEEEKLYNKSLASFHIKVERKFRELKFFIILSVTYQNFRLKPPMRLNIISVIVKEII
jgi:hypothetical protein